MIEKIKTIMKDKCTDKYSWQYHILPVVKYAKLLAKKLNADEEIVEVSAWLHDVKMFDDDENHHTSGPIEAEKILKELNYPNEKIEKVKHCIHSHRKSKDIKKESIEAECVASADVMAHFDSIPYLFYIAFTLRKMGLDEGKEWVKKKLERGWDKLIPEAKEMVKEKYEDIMKTL